MSEPSQFPHLLPAIANSIRLAGACNSNRWLVLWYSRALSGVKKRESNYGWWLDERDARLFFLGLPSERARVKLPLKDIVFTWLHTEFLLTERNQQESSLDHTSLHFRANASLKNSMVKNEQKVVSSGTYFEHKWVQPKLVNSLSPWG